MALSKPIPVKLTAIQKAQLKTLAARTKLNRSQILRLGVSYFLSVYHDRPKDVLTLFSETETDKEESGAQQTQADIDADLRLLKSKKHDATR